MKTKFKNSCFVPTQKQLCFHARYMSESLEASITAFRNISFYIEGKCSIWASLEYPMPNVRGASLVLEACCA